jgi:hypothetical protein
MVKGFAFVGWSVRQMPEKSSQSLFMIWALGASLFAHATTFISVSYFDQSFVLLYLTLAAIGSVRSGIVGAADYSKSRSQVPGLYALKNNALTEQM